MKIDEARLIAEQFIATQDMLGHTVCFVGGGPRPGSLEHLSVVFDLFSPKGNLIDGPMIIIVNKATKEACFFESP